jgi:hypothetical protein
MAWYDTADVYEPFDDDSDLTDLAADGWSIVNTDNNIFIDSTFKKTGTKSLRFNSSGDTTGVEDRYIERNAGSAITEVVVGKWFFFPDTIDTFFYDDVIDIGSNLPDDFCCKVRMYCSGGESKFRFEGTGVSYSVNITPVKWFWLVVHAEQNNTCILKIYDDSLSLLDTVTVTGKNYSCQYQLFGAVGGSLNYNDIDHWIDDIYIAWTDLTYPIIPEEAGGGIAPTGGLYGPLVGSLGGPV